MPRRHFLPFAAIALVVLAAPALGLAGSSQSASSLRAQNTALESRSRSAALELYSLDERAALAQARYARLQRDAASLRAERADLRQALAVARRGNRIAERQLAARLRLIYEQGEVEPLEIIFGSKTLDEALASIDNLNRMSAQGEDVLRQIEAAHTTLDAASGRLAARQAAITAALADARATADSLLQTRTERRAYISSLASKRRLNDAQISSLQAEASAAQVRSDALVRPTLTAPSPATRVAAAFVAATSAGRTMTVIATGYSMPGSTASGLRVGWGVAAVDPSVIPLGTHMMVPGYGSAVAADTGGAVSGATIDLWFPTAAQANAWGRRVVAITLR
jgi:3D (Asp-Asp-Asp) domain-containing protein/septal ring factor EnvC (AmiA/AmiB activator)